VQPLASLKALADPIYEAFYGLKEQPFAITTDPKFLYFGQSHERAFGEILNGLKRREGILLITGETGSGKTTLCRAVIEALGDRTFSAMILNPYMSGAEVFRIILRDFGLVSHEDLRRGAIAGADISQLLDTLEGFLRSLAPLGTHAIVVLDEAQSLSPQVLDQIRMLTALEQDGLRLAQIILCGQPALLTTLKTEPLYALNERITRRVSLAPLDPPEVDAYIHHRLAVAGGTESVRFQPEAATLVAELSRGLPRRVNVLCDRALQEGRVEGASLITPELVARAAKSLAGVHEPTGMPFAPLEPSLRSDPTVIQGTPGDTEDRVSSGWRRRGTLAGKMAVLTVLAAVGLYGYPAYQAVNGVAFPEPPAAPWRSLLPTAVPGPTDDEAKAAIDSLRRPSVQLPDDRDQLD
jgi:type II secretory pathway predicted ATPase ExeA